MDKFKTKDIFEASFIYSQDVDLANLELDSNYYWFVFMQKENAEKLSSLYWSGKAEGNIKKFVDSLKTLKDLVFSRKRD
ncbi:MAG: hypothetical protein UR29_C0010G0033 [Candidatus Woesebacteria bacterium GW2011_GWC2_33_12]|uniref:DUF5659 domain-containing protein n=1 Tax=Candidatus Woesebacteria bacterium GW2011_GWB1_33_22 TaxID=1618566 RepID=A0A0G0CMZ4_9BACT|nr:MAG: hypothetical protein UR29_C0010G0033 [Candidatus Woesebacteria bacterium GW2011_GWC2_33_12]KKP42058.1 MAG: hypothetical protein UR33_C0006G0042 [Candidatus Woesebacteria bacterium GW2011_GWA2_33_20]KKP44792.1 MAG: hypothetical protein UR35_C0006G0027 [Candidatus Woesebacteria bacterium GW2011_GWB1_33_22]KKP46611.1 MAG: hypothetical protein UR37_C0006G0061 [Microgenomates group bacterium GW2011_GWC1_33_28]KKP50524.1 MAG: hypothetical protein UR41_C0006G0027 [Candidatus Woesebacteria bact